MYHVALRRSISWKAARKMGREITGEGLRQEAPLSRAAPLLFGSSRRLKAVPNLSYTLSKILYMISVLSHSVKLAGN